MIKSCALQRLHAWPAMRVGMKSLSRGPPGKTCKGLVTRLPLAKHLLKIHLSVPISYRVSFVQPSGLLGGTQSVEYNHRVYWSADTCPVIALAAFCVATQFSLLIFIRVSDLVYEPGCVLDLVPGLALPALDKHQSLIPCHRIDHPACGPICAGHMLVKLCKEHRSCISRQHDCRLSIGKQDDS